MLFYITDSKKLICCVYTYTLNNAYISSLLYSNTFVNNFVPLKFRLYESFYEKLFDELLAIFRNHLHIIKVIYMLQHTHKSVNRKIYCAIIQYIICQQIDDDALLLQTI